MYLKNTFSVYLFLHHVFYVLSMNAQKLLHPIHEVLQQVNHEEYSQNSWRDL